MTGNIQKKILIVDDEEDVRLFLGDFISERDFYVDMAGDGEEALEKFKKTRHDIVLLDIMMPGIDGITCLGVIKKIAPEAVVIMITALKDESRMSAAKKLGAHQYIVKPFSLSYLEGELLKIIGKV